MMDFQLTIPAIVRRAESQYGNRTVATRRPDRCVVRHSYREILDRAKRLGAALQGLGVVPGDRVATLAWASHQHLEAYLAIPSIGAVLHTLNLRLHPDDLSYIVNDANAPHPLVDENMLDLWERIPPSVNIERVFVTSRCTARPIDNDYEDLLASA